MTLDLSELTILTISDAILPDQGLYQLLDTGQCSINDRDHEVVNCNGKRKSDMKLP